VNISTRSFVGTGSDVQIAGFVIAGTAPKSVLIHAAGPALNAISGLQGCLTDPAIELYKQDTHVIIAANNDWDSALAPAITRLKAFDWAVHSKDAALLATLIPGAYTVIVRGNDGGTGIALVEVYDAD
jgi:hypothetical protein